MLGSRARLSLHSTALAIVWITQLCLERICQAGLPSQGICGVLKQILVFHLLHGSRFVGVSSYASLINDMSQERKTGVAKFTFSTVKCNAS